MKKGKVGCLVIVLIFLGGLIFGITQMMKEPTKYQGGSVVDNILIDVTQFSRISIEELTSKMGEADSIEGYTSKASKGNFDMKVYSYQKDDSLIEFIIHEDSVVRMHYFPNKPISFKNENDTLGILGITPGKNIKKTSDTGTVLRFQSVSETIGGLDIYDLEKKNKTIGFVYITYNWNYFE